MRLDVSRPGDKDLAKAIIDDQAREIAQMRSWAKDWYGMEIADPVAMMDRMMGHGQGHNLPGMTPSGMPAHGDMSTMHDMSMMESCRNSRRSGWRWSSSPS